MKQSLKRSIAAWAGLFVAWLIASAPALAVQYTFTDVATIALPGNPDPGGVVGLNKNGAVAAFRSFPDLSSFLWTPTTPNGTTGTAQTIPAPGPFTFCSARALNDSGHVACDSSPTEQIWNRGTSFTPLPLLAPGFTDTVAGINNLDGVIGLGHGDSACPDCAIWWPAVGMPPVILDTRPSSGAGLNNTGAFVGQAMGDDGSKHATKWGFIGLGIVAVTLNGDTSYSSGANAVNDSGTAVGYVATHFCPRGRCPAVPKTLARVTHRTPAHP